MTYISIIISNFNREIFVFDCIRSAKAQFQIKTEIFFIDDGSTDESVERIYQFVDSVNIIRTTNGGVSRARNIGLRHARGDFIQFLDSDDLLPEGGLARQLAFAQTLSANEIAVGRTEQFYDDHAPLDLDLYNVSGLERGDVVPSPRIVSTVLNSLLCFYPRAILVAAGGFDESLRIGEDYELNFRLFRSGARFRYSGELCYLTRVHSGPRLSRSFKPSDHEALRRVMTDAASFLRQDYQAPDRTVALQTLARWAWSMGRSAARSAQDEAARAYFSLARSIDHQHCENGRLPMRTLYRFMDPVNAEHMLEHVKQLVRRVRG
jgi:glycosyltransferase involved in cell wall biosynthesis